VADDTKAFEEMTDTFFGMGPHKYMPADGAQFVRPLGDLQIRRTEPNLPGVLTFPFYYVRGKYRWLHGMIHLRLTLRRLIHLRLTLRRLPKRIKKLGYGLRELGVAIAFTNYNIERFSEVHAKSEREERKENVR